MSPPLPGYRVSVSSSVLRWARETAGLTAEEAAQGIVSGERLLAWEGDHSTSGSPTDTPLHLFGEEEDCGVKPPTVAQIRKLAKRYRRPVSVFLLSDPPAEAQSATFARHLHGASASSGKPSWRLAVREACERRELALSLLAQIGEQPREPEAVDVDPSDPEGSGEAMRAALSVSSKDISKWARVSNRSTLREWIDRIDATGVLITQFKHVEVGEWRGFSILETPLPLIAINQSDAVTARVFTLLHEYAHIQLAVNGFELDDEPWCNATAAAALMPAVDFRNLEASLGEDWTQKGFNLAEAFGVSRLAACRRLETLNLISKDDYSSAQSWYSNEPKPKRKSGTTGGPPHLAVKTREIGRGFIRIVGAAYGSDAISLHEASRFLEVKTRDVEDLISRAARA